MSKSTKKALSLDEIGGVSGGLITQMTDKNYYVTGDKSDSDGQKKLYGSFKSLTEAEKCAKRHFVSTETWLQDKHGGTYKKT